jgi:hypothetical protein
LLQLIWGFYRQLQPRSSGKSFEGRESDPSMVEWH